MIMKNININILDFSYNNNWHYEISIDDKRVISGFGVTTHLWFIYWDVSPQSYTL